MSKTDKNTLIDVIRQDCKDHSASTMGNGRDVYVREDLAIQAMQYYAQQQSEGFAEWIDKNCEKSSYKPYSRWYRPTAAYYTTSELYQLFTQQNQK